MLSALADDERLGSACILLKPVKAGMLQAFVESAETEWRQAEQVDTLRADRDVLLQYVLQANLRLQEYDQDRTNFLARALHDFRAPLTALYGYCGLLVEGQLGAVNLRQKELLQRMRFSTRRLTRLASGMFDLSVEGRVPKQLRLEEGDIDDSVRQALHELAPFIHEKQLAITAQLSPAPQPFFFEQEQVQQLLVNLIENACKFTPKQGSIDICGYPISIGDELPCDLSDAPAYRIDIRDTGPGLPPDQLTEIFEEYTSYPDSFGRSGGGLGLAICKMIVKSHGGRIWAESSENGGLFSFVLPFHPPAAPARHGPGVEEFSIRNDKAV
jgi:signal transduction histidine kinase